MTEELRQRLASLRTIAPQLNNATNDASAVVQSVERLLGEELSLGVSAVSSEFDVSVEPITNSDGDNALTRSHLAYGRVAGKYRVFILRNSFDEDSGEPLCSGQTPWSSAPREDKLLSFSKLPELLGLIADGAKRLADESTKTVSEVLSLIGPIVTKPDGGDPPPTNPNPPNSRPNPPVIATQLRPRRQTPANQTTRSIPESR